MSSIGWIGRREDTPREAAGYCTVSADEEDCEAIFVVVKRDDGTYSTRGFGDFTAADTAVVGTLMGYHAAKQMYGDGDGQ